MARLDVFTCDSCGNRIQLGFEVRQYAYPLLTTQEQKAIMDVTKKTKRTSLFQTTRELCDECTKREFQLEEEMVHG